jgi:hypothetical protein
MGYWREKVWGELTRPSVGLTIADTIKTIIRLAACVIIYVFLKLMAAYGFDAERIRDLETMDYWATFAVIGVFLVSQVIRQGVTAFAELRGRRD